MRTKIPDSARDAFTKVWSELETPVRVLAWIALRRPSDIDDLTQDVALELWQNWLLGRYEPVYAVLGRCAHRYQTRPSIHSQSRRRLVPAVSLSVPSPDCDGRPVRRADLLPAPPAPPSLDPPAWLRTWLAGLPPHHRWLLELVAKGYTAAEAGAEIGLTAAAAQRALTRMRAEAQKDFL